MEKSDTTIIHQPEIRIQIKPASELPSNADVVLYVDESTHKRYVRWVAGDHTDELPPTVVYDAPGWVWMLYQKGYDKAKEEAAVLTQW